MKACNIELLKSLCCKYETESFINGDPSWFMHQAKGEKNIEAVAFVASVLSFGSRKAFMPKIRYICEEAVWDVENWISKGLFKTVFREGDKKPFYRFFTYETMYFFFNAYKKIINKYGSLGQAIRDAGSSDAIDAMALILKLFADFGSSGVVPSTLSSACKRLSMFMRWMVRDSSPVDLGLWASFIDKKTLVLPLDTHVLSQSVRLGLVDTKSSSMAVARRITNIFAKYVFPDDPCRGDFALFGYGVNSKNEI